MSLISHTSRDFGTVHLRYTIIQSTSLLHLLNITMASQTNKKIRTDMVYTNDSNSQFSASVQREFEALS